ncbi:MAG: flavodoxin reductase, partial [Cyclobacteriaceae bacterium]|nr:flavodoxin reductase [Cyclobacteriaceae bacterium]
SGTAQMRQNFTLTDKELADGYILTCQAEITSPQITLTFDA